MMQPLLFVPMPQRLCCLRVLTFIGALAVLFESTSPGIAAELTGVSPFLQKYCRDCHSAESTEGGLNLEKLSKNLDDRALFAKWERLHDRVDRNEMPPKSATQPPSSERAAFLKQLGEQLSAAHAAQKGTVLRRLNRFEYQNTLNDLFGTNLELADWLPEDGRSHEFDNVGEALGISTVQMQQYLNAISTVLDTVIQKTIAPAKQQVVRASYADTRGGEQWLGKIWLKRDDGAVVFFKQYGYPSGMLREAKVQQDGWYNVRVTGYAFQSDAPITFSLGATTFARGVEQPTFGYFEFPPGKPTTIETRAWIPARYMIDILPYGITDRNNELRQKGVTNYDGPGLAIQHVEIEGPLIDEFPSRGHRLILDGLDRREIPPRNPADRNRSYYVPKFEIVSSNPSADVTPVLVRIATKAFRRPVTSDSVRPYVELFSHEMAEGATIEEALRAAVSAIFCSPDFLYLVETPAALRTVGRGASSSTTVGAAAKNQQTTGPLDDHALASRLSYFLTRTLPDDELLEAARSGKLTSDRATLVAQMDRLLKHPHSARFVADFTDTWLNLREIEFTNPDGALFPEFDPFLQFSMLAETRSFFRKLVDDNLSVVNVVKSDFAMLNNRLAEHYGIEGVNGPDIRPIKLSSDSVRGGFLSQASVLKVSANGTNTSPVVRGVWVTERILGQHVPPPPPGIPGVEPDIRGASTLRELLDKHRTLDTCRGCHQMIDPPGFALESFDPIGGWRDRFRSFGGERVNREVRGQKVRYTLGLPVDASGQLADGRDFNGFRQFRDLLANDPQTLAKALTTKLLTFATGREMGFSDREEIHRIVRASASRNYGVRDLLREVVLSEIFRHK